MRWLRLVAAVNGRLAAALLVSLLIGCGDGRSASVETRSDGEPPGVPGRFTDALLAVATDHVVAFNFALTGEGTTGIVGEIYDLETGELSEVASPAGDLFLVNEAGALDDSVIVGGVTCRSLVFVDNDPDQCAQQTQSFRLDPEAGEWTPLSVPEGWSSMLIVQAGLDGSVLATFRNLGASTEYVALLNGDAWEPLAEIPSRQYSTSCATSEAVYRLAGDTIIEQSEAGPPTDWTVQRISFEGDVEDLETPDLYPYLGLAPVQLACAEDGPLLMSTVPGEPTSLFRGDGAGGWEAVEGGIGTDGRTGVRDVLSSASGPAVIIWEDVSTISDRGVGQTRAAMVDGGGSIRELSGDFANHRLDWKGGHADLVAIGPWSEGEETDPGGVGPPEHMEVLPVEEE